jgi:hypothetical protein
VQPFAHLLLDFAASVRVLALGMRHEARRIALGQGQDGNLLLLPTRRLHLADDQKDKDVGE